MACGVHNIICTITHRNYCLQQHKDYNTVPWVICSLCQDKDADMARLRMPKGLSTSGLLRHIESFHPNKLVKKTNENALPLIVRVSFWDLKRMRQLT